MNYDRRKPLIVQKDLTVLLETRHPDFEYLRKQLGGFAELVKHPSNIHTYRITPLSLWNAVSAGVTYEDVIHCLQSHSKMPLSMPLCQQIGNIMGRYGLLRLEAHGDTLRLVIDHIEALKDVLNNENLSRFFMEQIGSNAYTVDPGERGAIKQEFMRHGYPIIDLAGYQRGEPLSIELRSETRQGVSFQLRDYQAEAVDTFMRMGSGAGGSGLLVLPCGAGKTIIGIAVMANIGSACLVLTTNTSSVKQWIREILDKTTLAESAIGEYTGQMKQVRPVTVATYQILTHRRAGDDDFAHMQLFQERDWGLIIYDEVHLLPAPVFRATAGIQAKRRLGLTGTLVREDGKEEDVFSLVGPKTYEIPWKDLEQQGWIASVDCAEIRVPLPPDAKLRYSHAGAREQYRIAGENSLKLAVLHDLLTLHAERAALVIGQYLEQLSDIAERFRAPMISGRTPQSERERLYRQFRNGDIPLLIVSKVANFAIDLPDASLAIQVSGSFGSRQEEAQRLGRILRPKEGDNKAHFYSIVSQETREQDFAMKRQLFLLEQGYRYKVKKWQQRMERIVEGGNVT